MRANGITCYEGRNSRRKAEGVTLTLESGRGSMTSPLRRYPVFLQLF